MKGLKYVSENMNQWDLDCAVHMTIEIYKCFTMANDDNRKIRERGK